jgi:hypothetical protein
MKRILILLGFVILCVPSLVLAADFFERLDETEQQAMMETLQYALERNRQGEESSWANPETGTSGAVVALERFSDDGGRTCRNFISIIAINGDEERSEGTACRQEDGLWTVVDSRISTAYAAGVARRYVYIYRDPYVYGYPWVYYAPAYYPYRVFFSFVFAGHYGHFHHRPWFHDGRRYVGHPHFRTGPPRPSPRAPVPPGFRPPSGDRRSPYPHGGWNHSPSPSHGSKTDLKARPPERRSMPPVRPSAGPPRGIVGGQGFQRPDAVRPSGTRFAPTGRPQIQPRVATPPVAPAALQSSRPQAGPGHDRMSGNNPGSRGQRSIPPRMERPGREWGPSSSPSMRSGGSGYRSAGERGAGGGRRWR